MLLYIIRHGDPIYSTDSLTERGKLQAEALAKRLAASGIDRVFSSPMGRARMTAEPTCRLLGLEYSIEEWAHEVGDERKIIFPNGEFKSLSWLQNDYFRRDGGADLDFYEAYDEPHIAKSGMKKAQEYIAKSGDEFLERLGYKQENGIYKIITPHEEKVALFCHTVLARTWLSYLLRVPLHLMLGGFQMTHTGVTVLEFENHADGYTAPKLLCFSDMSHLYSEGLDMIHGNKIEI